MDRLSRLDHTRGLLLVEAMAAGARIATISRVALDRGIPVRWFRFGLPPGGGDSQFLVPVNAREVVRMRRQAQHHIPLLAHLALTTANRESLVFHSPVRKQEPGVLFCSDSDFAFTAPIPKGVGLATAPHHGSESNAGVYRRIDRDGALGPNAAWVRSTSRSPAGTTFRGRTERKYCTLCRGSGTPKHDVVLTRPASAAVWVPGYSPRIPVCAC